MVSCVCDFLVNFPKGFQRKLLEESPKKFLNEIHAISDFLSDEILEEFPIKFFEQ